MVKIAAVSSVFTAVILPKCGSGWGSAPDLAGRVYNVFPDSPVGLGGTTFPHGHTSSFFCISILSTLTCCPSTRYYIIL